jgi:hypothetical protein
MVVGLFVIIMTAIIRCNKLAILKVIGAFGGWWA